jgi:hypothetical protein
MSHVDMAQTVYTDLTDVAAAARRLGGELKLNQTQHQVYYAKATCDHAIRFNGAQYEVGVVRQSDGTFRLKWDGYHTGGLGPKMGRDAEGGLFAQAYALEAAKRAAEAAGHMVSETRRADGYVEMELLVRA